MSIEDLVEAGKSSIRVATLVITAEYHNESADWYDAQGKLIAHCLGYPALCVNSPTREKCHCVHLFVYWENVLGTKLDSQDYTEYEASEELERWINQQPVTASKCESVGPTHITRGTWHAGKNRWMWGPKLPRR